MKASTKKWIKFGGAFLLTAIGTAMGIKAFAGKDVEEPENEPIEGEFTEVEDSEESTDEVED